jgi:hypothetical protein
VTVRVARAAGVAAVLAFAPGVAVAQGAGSGATTILRLSPDPRALALGHAYAAVRDAAALEFNPGGLAGPGTVVASYQGLPVDVAAGTALLVVPVGSVTLGASVRYLDYGEVAVIEEGGDLPVGSPTGDVATGSEVSALLGAAVALGPVRVGAAARWLRQDVAGLADGTGAFDIGVTWGPTGWLDLGASVQHMGPDVEAGRAAPLPRTVRLGAAVAQRLGSVDLRVLGEVREREERRSAGFGLEAATGGDGLAAALRLGYETRPDPGDAYAPLVVGGGVSLGPLAVDLAWRALGPLGSTRQIGLRYRF